MVSIIIPCHNHRIYLAEAIESARSQRGVSTEIVVVDDGSTDGSGEIARRYVDVRAITQPNRGISSARNAGFEASRGEIVIFLDADDRLWPDAAAIAVEALGQRPDAALAYGRCQLIDAAGRPMPTNHLPAQGDTYTELLRRNFIWNPAAAAFRRTAMAEAGGFDTAVDASADYAVYLQLARRYPFVAHGQVVADYRRHPGNMSNDPVLMLRTTLRVLERQRPFIKGSEALRAAAAEGDRAWRSFYGEQLVDRFREELRRRHLAAAAQVVWNLLRLYPSGVRRHLRRKAALIRSGVRAA